MSLDQRRDVACHELDLPSLVAQRPQVDALAPRRRVPREKLCAVFRGSDADLTPEVVAISIQQRREHLTEHTITLRAILGHPRPHRGEGVRKAVRVAAAAGELARQQLARLAEALRSRVVGRGDPAVSGSRDPAQARVRSPASDPQGDAVRLTGDRRELEISRQRVVVGVRGGTASAEQGPQRGNRLVEPLPALVEGDAEGLVVADRRARARGRRSVDPRRARPGPPASLPAGPGPGARRARRSSRAVRSPLRSITLASAVGPSSHGVEKTK